MRKGDVWLINLDPTIGAEIKKTRPAVIVSENAIGSARPHTNSSASFAWHAAIKVNMPLSPEKMRGLIDRLLQTSSPTTCPHGRPVILRLATRDILKGFHRI